MKVFDKLEDIDIKQDVWHTLSHSDKPIVMYGMGNGADKIIEALGYFGVEISDFFASDGFVRGQSFHGKRVLSYSQICEKYSDFNIVVSFGTRLPEVLENIRRLDSERELFIPDVPVVCDSLRDELFTLEYFEKNRQRLSAVCEMLSDEVSRRTLLDVIAFRLTGRLEFLDRHITTPDEVHRDILRSKDFKLAADLGAYNGDSIRELSGFSKPSRVIALEPDRRSFRKLCEYAKNEAFAIDCVNSAAWDEDTELSFAAGGNRNSSASSSVGLKTGAKLCEVSARRLDSVLSELGLDSLDYIKYDVEGAEEKALLGSSEIIASSHPRLLVSLYHRTKDIFALPELVHKMGYEGLFIRRYEYVPAWDLNLLGI